MLCVLTKTRTLMKLTPQSRVLDMGCGKGQACVDVAACMHLRV